MKVKIINHTEKQLWEKYLNEENDSLDELYELMFPKLFFYAYSFTNDQDLAKEAVSNSFKKLLEDPKKAESFDTVSGFLREQIRATWFFENYKKDNLFERLDQFIDSLRLKEQISSEDYKEIKLMLSEVEEDNSQRQSDLLDLFDRVFFKRSNHYATTSLKKFVAQLLVKRKRDGLQPDEAFGTSADHMLEGIRKRKRFKRDI